MRKTELKPSVPADEKDRGSPRVSHRASVHTKALRKSGSPSLRCTRIREIKINVLASFLGFLLLR